MFETKAFGLGRSWNRFPRSKVFFNGNIYSWCRKSKEMREKHFMSTVVWNCLIQMTFKISLIHFSYGDWWKELGRRFESHPNQTIQEYIRRRISYLCESRYQKLRFSKKTTSIFKIKVPNIFLDCVFDILQWMKLNNSPLIHEGMSFVHFETWFKPRRKINYRVKIIFFWLDPYVYSCIYFLLTIWSIKL